MRGADSQLLSWSLLTILQLSAQVPCSTPTPTPRNLKSIFCTLGLYGEKKTAKGICLGAQEGGAVLCTPPSLCHRLSFGVPGLGVFTLSLDDTEPRRFTSSLVKRKPGVCLAPDMVTLEPEDFLVTEVLC